MSLRDWLTIQAAKDEQAALLDQQHKAAAETTFKDIQSGLLEVAKNNRGQIRTDAEFRAGHQAACSITGIEPIQLEDNLLTQLSMRKYWTLFPVIMTICLAERERTGGLMALDKLLEKAQLTQQSVQIREADIEKSIEVCQVLGAGCVSIVDLFDQQTGETRRFLSCIPEELSDDQTFALTFAEYRGGNFTIEALQRHARENDKDWIAVRAPQLATHFVREGLAWIDDADLVEERGRQSYHTYAREDVVKFRFFWFPGMVAGAKGKGLKMQAPA